MERSECRVQRLHWKNVHCDAEIKRYSVFIWVLKNKNKKVQHNKRRDKPTKHGEGLFEHRKERWRVRISLDSEV